MAAFQRKYARVWADLARLLTANGRTVDSAAPLRSSFIKAISTLTPLLADAAGWNSHQPREGNPLQVLVRDNNIDQALRVLKKKMQREGVFREMKQRQFLREAVRAEKSGKVRSDPPGAQARAQEGAARRTPPRSQEEAAGGQEEGAEGQRGGMGGGGPWAAAWAAAAGRGVRCSNLRRFRARGSGPRAHNHLCHDLDSDESAGSALTRIRCRGLRPSRSGS